MYWVSESATVSNEDAEQNGDRRSSIASPRKEEVRRGVSTSHTHIYVYLDSELTGTGIH